MLIRLISGDRPGGVVLSLVLIAIALGLAFAPFLFPGTRSLDTAARICIFIALVASYDLLLGYTGIVSFAHTMFFGLGAYGVAIALKTMGPSFTAVVIGAALGTIAAALLALLIGLFSLGAGHLLRHGDLGRGQRLRAAGIAALLSHRRRGRPQLHHSLLADAGLSPLPRSACWVSPSTAGSSATTSPSSPRPVLFLLMLRVVNSPFGRVLQACARTRSAPRRSAIAWSTTAPPPPCFPPPWRRSPARCWRSWLRYTGPATTLSLEIMVDILLMIVIGGMGTMYGAVLGATVFIIAQNYLQNLMKLASEATAAVPLLPNLLHPDRWLLWLGLLFILSVYFFPAGIVGRLRGRA